MQARSALFDVYGDHLRDHGHQAPVAALVRLLAPLGVAAPAVRTAVSRMVRQGWLEPVALPAGRGYLATDKAVQRLEEAWERVYRVTAPRWDGRWHVVVLERIAERGTRERLRGGLGFLGYASLGDATWVAARPSPGLDELLHGEGVRAERFLSVYDGDASEMVGRAWDLAALARSYEHWLAQARAIVRRASDAAAAGSRDAGEAGDASDVHAFATRSALVHEWRKFLFTDPGLPASLLPADWPGVRASAFFNGEAERLHPSATRFVASCLAGPSQPSQPSQP